MYFAAKTIQRIKIKAVKGLKIVFVSNYFNHHQKPFCEELYKRLGDNFKFISTSVMREERKELGYVQNDFPDYVVLSYESEQQKKLASLLIKEADVVIAGSTPKEMLVERIRSGKLIFRYSERPFKREKTYIKRVYHAINFRKNNLFKKNIYMLCASAYAAVDYASIGMYKKRMYKWGYFPEVKGYNTDELMAKKECNTLLWCGRFIDWKHPDDAINIARKLKENGYDFRLNMIGTGVMEDSLKLFVQEYHLDDVVHFLGSMSPEQVRKHMEEAGIYLFTSDRQEGWGAVLNESMNSGCAVVASHAIGAVPYLIKNGENGIIYESENIEMLYEKVKYLLDYPEKQQRLGTKAYETIITEWSAKTAAERLLNLIDSLLKRDNCSNLYEKGPCSRAELLYDDCLKEDLQ